MANKNRDKGHRAERHYAQVFRDAGWGMVKTTRHSSRLKDDCKIDLDFLPFLVQIKAGYKKGINYSAILTDICQNLEKNFPAEDPIHGMIKAIIHRKDVGRGKRRRPEDEIVSMTFNDFLTLIKLAYGE